MTIYTNLNIMLQDMISFMRAAGPEVNILPADDPGQGTMGFCAQTEPPIMWEISLQLIGETNDALREAFRTAEGRTALMGVLRRQSETHTMAVEGLRDQQTVWADILAGEANRRAQQEPESPPLVSWDRLGKET